MSDFSQLDIQVNIEDEKLDVNLKEDTLQSDFEMGIIAKKYENDYNKLKNQPQINGKTLIGDNSAQDLGLVSSSLSSLDGIESPTTSFRERANIFVDDNGKPRRMTLQQVKEMCSKVARTSDEMKSLLVEDNLGDLVTYIGENTVGGVVGTPFQVGDEFATAYLNTSIELDFSSIDFSSSPQQYLLVATTSSPIIRIDVIDATLATGGAINGYIMQIYDGDKDKYAYTTEEMTINNLLYPKGWSVRGYDSNYQLAMLPFDISGDTPIDFSTIDGYTWNFVVSSAPFPEVLVQFLSKTPFVAGVGYKKDSVYQIVKNDNGEIVAVLVNEDSIRSIVTEMAIPFTEKGQPNGVATLDGTGKVPKEQLSTMLPEITEADDGKILEAENGEWVVKELATEEVETADVDTAPIQGSENLVTSGGVYNAIAEVTTSIPKNTSQLVNDSGYVTETQVDAKIEELTHISSGTIEVVKELEKALDEHADEYDALLQQVGNKANKADVEEAINERGNHFVAKDEFSYTAGASNLSMKWTMNGIDGITEPVDGMVVQIQIPATSAYASGVVMSIDGGKTYHPVLRNKVTALTTAYQQDVIVSFIYNSLLSTRAYLTSGVQTTIQGCWQVADYDSDRTVQQNKSTTDEELPILGKVNSNADNTTGNVNFSPDVTMNPSTGSISATEFFEGGVSLADKYGGGNTSGMPVIRLVKVSDMDRTGIISPTNPLRVTIQVLAGTILPTDKIELCSRKAFTYKMYDEAADATRKKGRRWRLRKIAEKSAEECHPDKSFPDGMYRMICWNSGDDVTPRAFLRSDNVYSARKWVTKYVRVSRMNNEGDIFHSNAVAFSFSIDNLLKPEKHTAKIHIN